MNINIAALIVASVTMSAIAQLFLKLGMSGPAIQKAVTDRDGVAVVFSAALSGHVWAGLMLYVLSVMLWLFVLAKTELSFAYPFVSLGFLLTLLFGIVVLNESVSFYKVAGTFMVVMGVILVSRG